MEFDFEQEYKPAVNIKVIGCGGGGNNAVNRMITSNIQGVEFIAINTDKQVIDSCCAAKKLVIGEKTTHGKGAGSNPEIGKRSAEESADEIRKAIDGADMVFITAGMGGGTGTGAAPVVAKIAQELDILTIGIVTKPFGFEGKRRLAQAEEGIKQLQESVDSLIVIPNERLKLVEETKITLANAFEIADDVLRRGVQSVSDVINVPGFINLDFADVTTVMNNAGYAHMGVGSAKGEDKARAAAQTAICSPLLETSISGATGVLISITASPDISLEEVDIASNIIREEAHPDANIIWGATFDDTLTDEMRVTIIATGFDAIHADGTSVSSAPARAPENNPFRTAPKTPVVERPAPIPEEPAAADDVFDQPAYAPVSQPEAREVPRKKQPFNSSIDDTYQAYEQLFTQIRKSKK